jgi:NitT/TauT family transport system substrate-binding protein
MKILSGRSAKRLAFAVGMALAPTSCSPPREPLRIGVDHSWPPYGILYLAEEKGFYEQEKVPVRLFDFTSVSDSRRAYETGKLDGLAGTIVEVLAARDASQRDLKIVHIVDISEGADVVNAPTKVSSMQGLKGQRVGAEPLSVSTYVLIRALEKAGMRPSDIRPVPHNPEEIADAMLAGQLEAAATYPPASTRVLADPRFHEIFSSREIPGVIVDIVAVDAEVMRNRPQDAAAFLRAINRAYEYLQANPEESLHIMAKHEGFTPEALGKMFREDVILSTPDQQAAYLAKGGKLQTVVDHTARTLNQAGVLSDDARVTDCIYIKP